MKKIKIILPIGVVAAAAIAGGFFYYYKSQSDLVYSSVIVEAGSKEPDLSEFLKKEVDMDQVALTSDSTYDINTPGDYPLTIIWDMPMFGRQTYDLVLTVQDTTPPVITPAVEKMSLYTTADTPKAEDFVDSVEDITDCTLDFAGDYDFSTEGSFDVEITATDTSGNASSISVPVTVLADKTAPVIEGVEPITVSMGDTVSFKSGITVTDDIDPEPSLEVDSSKVNLDKRGSYTVTYTATDAAGNSTSQTTTVKVVSSKIAAATAETVNTMADEILATIITDGMTQLQQAKAVFDWVVDNITYSESAGMDDLYSAAYKGMYYHIGDCTVKQKTAEVMLNRLGIKNMEIEKIRDTRGHYWLLIDVGEGWYHYDPNLQLDGTKIFYWHDADLWAYSNSHKNTHNYDPSKYPTIQ